jgi:hypothetical protein
MKMLDPILQAQAVTSLRESLTALGEGDDVTLLLDMVEGETTFYEAVDRIIAQIADDLGMVDSIKLQIGNLSARSERFAKRAETAKALLEQAFVIADLPKVERPGATLFLSNRAPKAVIETESDIPARFWKTPEPVLDKRALLDDLKGRKDGLEAVLAAEPGARAEVIAVFAQRFLDADQVAQLRELFARLDALPEPEGPDEVRERDAVKAEARLRFASVPGATLSAPGRSLSMRVA